MREWQWLRLKPAGRGAARYHELRAQLADLDALWPRLLAIDADVRPGLHMALRAGFEVKELRRSSRATRGCRGPASRQAPARRRLALRGRGGCPRPVGGGTSVTAGTSTMRYDAREGAMLSLAILAACRTQPRGRELVLRVFAADR